jgi:Asp-tRNA(Asn)/Glu-tRNA(Gln) amidotransferase C subunit
MPDMSKSEVTTLAKAVSLTLKEPELTEVTYHFDALLEAIESIEEPGLETMEHVPVILLPIRQAKRRA